mgnify:CR=1 FL=1
MTAKTDAIIPMDAMIIRQSIDATTGQTGFRAFWRLLWAALSWEPLSPRIAGRLNMAKKAAIVRAAMTERLLSRHCQAAMSPMSSRFANKLLYGLLRDLARSKS